MEDNKITKARDAIRTVVDDDQYRALKSFAERKPAFGIRVAKIKRSEDMLSVTVQFRFNSTASRTKHTNLIHFLLAFADERSLKTDNQSTQF